MLPPPPMPPALGDGSVVANGVFTDAYTFEADELLAKHDENYSPREIQETLQEQGVYRGEEPTS